MCFFRLTYLAAAHCWIPRQPGSPLSLFFLEPFLDFDEQEYQVRNTMREMEKPQVTCHAMAIYFGSMKFGFTDTHTHTNQNPRAKFLGFYQYSYITYTGRRDYEARITSMVPLG